MYRYRATLVRVVDGDTVDLDVDVGFYLTARLRFRLLGYDAPEMHGPTLAMAIQARDRLERMLGAGRVVVDTEKGDSFGRWLCHITTSERGVSFDVVEELIRGGWGRRWDGKGTRAPWDPKAPYPELAA